MSPVFDVAEQLVLVDLVDGQEQSRGSETLGKLAMHDRARRLIEKQVDVLVCGAISRSLELLLVAGGVRVLALRCGDVDEVVQAYRDGTLQEGRFIMPGCCRGRQRGGGGGGGGGGGRRRRRRGYPGSGLEELE